MIWRASGREAGAALLLFFVGHGVRGARALADEATTKVTVIRPTGGDVALSEIATRAWAELSAGGVVAILLDCPADGDGCRTETPAPGGNAITLRTFRQSDETITEAALTPAGHDRPTVRRSLTVSDETAVDPKVMAIRAVELVNAMLLQVDSAAAETAEAWRRAAVADAEFPGQHVKIESPSGTETTDSDLALGAGGSFLAGPGGLGAAFGFAICASGPVHNRFGLSVLLTEAPSRTGTATIDGTLSTNQQLGAIEVTYRLYRNSRVRSHVALGYGVYHVSASWTGTPGTIQTPAPADLWAMLVSGGGGAALALGHEMSFYLETRLVFASPNPVFFDPEGRALKTADPSVLVSLGLQRTF